MTYKHWRTLNRVLTNAELSTIDAELDHIDSYAGDDEAYLVWADFRCNEIIQILEESHRKARVKESGFRLIKSA